MTHTTQAANMKFFQSSGVGVALSVEQVDDHRLCTIAASTAGENHALFSLNKLALICSLAGGKLEFNVESGE